MKLASVAFWALGLSVVSSMPLDETSKERSHEAAPRVDKRDGVQLTDEHGPYSEEIAKSIFNDRWESSWFYSVAGAIAHAAPATAKKLFTSQGTEKAIYHFYNYKNEVQDIEVIYDHVPENADYSRSTMHWWPGGAEVAAQRLGGILGADIDKLSMGSPADAFQMMTGKLAGMEQVKTEQQFFDWAKKAKDIPMVFGLGADPERINGWEPWQWYILKGVEPSTSLKEGAPEWENAQLVFWSATNAEDEKVSINKVTNNIRKIVWCEGLDK